MVKRCLPKSEQDIHDAFPQFTVMDDGCTHRSINLLESSPRAQTGLSAKPTHRRATHAASQDSDVSFENFVKYRYGIDSGLEAGTASTEAETDKLAVMNVTVRRKDTTPYFIYPEEEKLITAAINSVELNKDIPPVQKDEMVTRLKAKLLNRQRMVTYTAPSREEESGFVYDYFPRVEIDFSAKLNTVNEQDSFKHLGFLIKLKSNVGAQIIDFSPKEADIVDFTRGTMERNATLTLAPSITKTVTDTALSNIAGQIADSSDTDTETISRARGLGTTGLVFSEKYTNDLMDALERRTTGILENGKVFFADYRSVRNKRIAGAFSYDLMLRVSAWGQEIGNSWVSTPQLSDVVADVYLLGVIRHVEKRGMSGTLNRAPEVENDDVFEQVVVKKISDEVLWVHNFASWAELISTNPDTTKITIYSNNDEASFGIFEQTTKDSGTYKLLKVGRGKKFDFDYTGKQKLKVVAYDIITKLDKQALMFTPKKREVELNDGATSVVIEYKL